VDPDLIRETLDVVRDDPQRFQETKSDLLRSDPTGATRSVIAKWERENPDARSQSRQSVETAG